MAAHGIDTPLAMKGQDYVWRMLWRETGMSEAQVAESMSAAPFLPWQRSCRSASLPGCARWG